NSQTVRDDNGRDVFRSSRFLRGNDQILFVVLRQSPNGAYSGSLPDRIGEVIIREPLRGKAGWIGDDLDLADVTPLHINPSHSRHAGNERLELVARDVVQRRRVAPFEIIGQDWEQRWRHSLDFNPDLGRERCTHLIDARLNLLERVGHVGVVRERDADLAPTADGARTHARQTRHDAHRLFDGPGNSEEHLSSPEGGALRHDEDSREGELGVDRGRKFECRVDAARTHQRHEQVDEPALRGEQVEERFHYLACATLTLSSSPYAPSVATRSPAASPL